MSRCVALTGGAGFLGRCAIRAFADAGWRIRSLTRRAFDAPELADIYIDLTLGDLGDAGALRRLCAGADAVVHIAGLVKARSAAEFHDVNAAGAGRIADAWAETAPDARFLMVSSIAARRPDLSDYAASKRAGEAALDGRGGDWAILRPGAVYGPRDLETLKILKLANGPAQAMLNRGDARLAMIDVRDAAAALVAFAERPGLNGVWELTDGRPGGWRWDELTRLAAAALGRVPRPVRLPAALIRVAALTSEAKAALTDRAEMLTCGKAREILHLDWSGDPALAPPPDVWSPKIDLADGLAEMVRWARGTGAF